MGFLFQPILTLVLNNIWDPKQLLGLILIKAGQKQTIFLKIVDFDILNVVTV